MHDFHWLNKQGVQSGSGFVVQFTGRFTAEYREAGRVLEVEVEAGIIGGNQAICYDKFAFRNWSSSVTEQQRVADNFRDALVFQGLVPAPS